MHEEGKVNMSRLFWTYINTRAMARTFAFLGTANIIGKKGWEELVWFVVIALCADHGWS